jgi:hypothetical protein
MGDTKSISACPSVISSVRFSVKYLVCVCVCVMGGGVLNLNTVEVE